MASRQVFMAMGCGAQITNKTGHNYVRSAMNAGLALDLMSVEPLLFGLAAVVAEFDCAQSWCIGRNDAATHNAGIGVRELLACLVITFGLTDEAIGNAHILGVQLIAMQFAFGDLAVALRHRGDFGLVGILSHRIGASHSNEKSSGNECFVDEHEWLDLVISFYVPDVNWLLKLGLLGFVGSEPFFLGYAALGAEFDGLDAWHIGHDDAAAHDARPRVRETGFAGLIVTSGPEGGDTVGDTHVIDFEMGTVHLALCALGIAGSEGADFFGGFGSRINGADCGEERGCNEQFVGEHAASDHRDCDYVPG